MNRGTGLRRVGRKRQAEADAAGERVWSTFRAEPRPIPQESARRKAERPARQAVREATLRRAGDECQGKALWPEVECWGPLDVDESVSRGVRPGAHLEEGLTQALCRGHHDARHAYPEEAHRRGLRRKSWEVR